jgi:hypothetical protein
MVLRVIAVRVLGSEKFNEMPTKLLRRRRPWWSPYLKANCHSDRRYPGKSPSSSVARALTPQTSPKILSRPRLDLWFSMLFFYIPKNIRSTAKFEETEERFHGQAGDFPALPSSRGLRRKSADVSATGRRPNKNGWTARTVIGPIEPNEHYSRGAQRLVNH